MMEQPLDNRKESLQSPWSGLLLSIFGFLFSLALVVAFFAIAINKPEWRGSGMIPVAGCGIGFLMGVWGLIRSLRLRRWRIATLGVCLLTGGVAAFLPLYIFYLARMLPDAAKAIAAGVPAPDFKLRDQTGQERTLGNLSGKRVVLVFFRGHWCPFCVGGLKSLQSRFEDFKAAGAEIVAISSSSVEDHRKLAERIGASFWILSDVAGEAIRKYGVLHENAMPGLDLPISRPAVFFIDAGGIIRKRFLTETLLDRERAEHLLEEIKEP